MTIETSYTPLAYAGNGVTNAFAITWPYQFDTDIVVKSEVVATGVITTLTLGTDYTVSPTVNSPATVGTVTMLATPATGIEILITRSTPVTQETAWLNNASNPAVAIENAVDKLTMIEQELIQSPFQIDGTSDQFLRGDNVLTNTLVGTDGEPTVPADPESWFNVSNNAVSAQRVLSGATDVGAYRFGYDGSSNPWDMQWAFDPATGKLGWYTYGGSALGTFDGSGNFTATGTVDATLFTGAADASLITTGTIGTDRLGSGTATSNTFLRGDQTWAVVTGGGGGGINTTTTASFTIAAVDATQTVSVTDATGIVVGTDLQVSDGSHLIIGLVTAVAGLDLTVKTQAISLGSAADTMASGAAVQPSGVPGNNTIQITDLAISPASMSTLTLAGDVSNAGASTPFGFGSKVKLYIASSSGGSYTVGGYFAQLISTVQIAQPELVTKPGVVGYSGTDSSIHGITSSSGNNALLSNSSPGTNPSWAQITAPYIASGTITPALLNLTNSLTNNYLFGYDSASGHFKMFAPSATLPTTTNAGQFLRADVTYSSILDLNASSGEGAGALTLANGVSNGSFGMQFAGFPSGGTVASWAMTKRVAGSWGTPTGVHTNYVIGGSSDGALLSIRGTATTIDSSSLTETLYSPAMMRTDMGLRDVYGPWHKINEIDMTGVSAKTVDLNDGAYQRLVSFDTGCVITLDDTSAVPSNGSYRYASELTLEIVAPAAYITSWAATGGTIVWANGASAPTLSSSGTNIVTFVRSQDQTYWIGKFAQPATGTGTVTSVASGSGLTGGPITTTGTLSIATGGVTGGASGMIASGTITNTNINASAAIAVTKLALPGGTTTFLRGDGTWQVPPGTGGGGSGASLTANQTWTGVNTYTNRAVWSNTFGSPYTGATGTVMINDTYPNDSVGPETAVGLKTYINNTSVRPDVDTVAYALVAEQTNRSTTAGLAQGCAKIRMDTWQNITSQFGIATQSLAQYRRVNGASADSVWLASYSPSGTYSGTPDGEGITHSFGSGDVRAGEVDYGNAWADLGYVDTRGVSRYVAGLEFFPDWLPGSGMGGSTDNTKYDASWAIAIGNAPPGNSLGTAKNWTGILIDTDGITPTGLGINIHGGSSSGNATGAAINIQNYHKTGINFAGTTGGAPGGSAATIVAETVSGHSNQAAITLVSGQAICFKSPTGANTGVYIWFNGTNLVASKDGGATTATIV